MRASLFKRGRLWHAKVKRDTWTDEKRIFPSHHRQTHRLAETRKVAVQLSSWWTRASSAPKAARQGATPCPVDLCESFVAQLDCGKLTVIAKTARGLKMVRQENRWTQLHQVTETAFRQVVPRLATSGLQHAQRLSRI